MRRWGNKTDARSGVTIFGNVLRNLESRQFSSFTRFGTLGHLDLNLITIGKVVRCDTESTRCNLLDTRTTVVFESLWIFTTFSGVRASSKCVHGNCKSFVGFLTDGTQRHGTGSESLNNFRNWFNFFQWNSLGRIKLEFELSSKRNLLVLFVGDSCKFFVSFSGASSSGNLQIDHGFGSVQMRLTTVSVVELTITANQDEIIVVVLGERVLVESFKIAVDCLKVSSLDTSRGARKASINNLIGETDGLEHLSSLVTLKGGDTHLTHDLQQSLTGCIAVVLVK
mmetsp:Transcript_10028/g.20920  ORF Transcript_10028/g.20920 Transcript_10028/m.20920 type:complete len:282 (+) Transcript_10028:1635-2480(+)